MSRPARPTAHWPATRAGDKRNAEDAIHDDDGLQPDPPADRLDWGPALAWLPALEAADFSHGSDLELVPVGGVHEIRNGVWADLVADLAATLYETGIVAGFDWPRWMAERGRRLREDPAELAGASLEDCRRLLTAVVRADRFAGGGLFAALQSGEVHAVLRRVAELTDHACEEGPPWTSG